MERRKTMSLNWDGIGEVKKPVIGCLQPSLSTWMTTIFDDCRMSFASTASPIKDFRGGGGGSSIRAPESSVFGDYGMWLVEPGSISERQRWLFQGMGLTSNKRLLSITSAKFMHAPSVKIGDFHAASKKINSNHHQDTSAVEKPPTKEAELEHEPEPVILTESSNNSFTCFNSRL